MPARPAESDAFRSYQAYLLRERKLRPLTVRLHVAALRFFFVKTLKRRYLLDDTPYPKAPRRLPQILSVEEVARVIDAADSLSHRTMLMVLYSTGMRNAELRHLQVADIDSRRMLIHIQRGKGGRDRYVPLSPTLLTTLRVYYRWMRPKTWLFPGTVNGWRADKPITPKVLWEACVVQPTNRDTGHARLTRSVLSCKQAGDAGQGDARCHARGRSNEEIVNALHQVDSGEKVAEVCRRLGVSEQRFYRSPTSDSPSPSERSGLGGAPAHHDGSDERLRRSICAPLAHDATAESCLA